jgi:DNA-directed RNA polymerase subunit RPC12/RpoP
MTTNPIVKCIHCNQWAALYTKCGNCGAPVEKAPPDEKESPMVACEHCKQFGLRKTECLTCGAPMPDHSADWVYGPDTDFDDFVYGQQIYW